MSIHVSAIIDKDAKLGNNVTIDPYVIVGKGVTIGEGAVIEGHVHLVENVQIGCGCTISSGAVLGGNPQILDWKGADSSVIIGDNVVIREYVTIHRSGKDGEATKVGNNCYLMAYTHLAHDCHLEEGVIITNYTGLPGHVFVGEKTVISGYVGIHQFVRIGKLCMVSGLSRVPKDVPPFSLVEGNPVRVLGPNVIGLRRNNINQKVRSDLKKALRLLCRSGMNTKQAMEKIKQEVEESPELSHLIDFVESSERGICK